MYQTLIWFGVTRHDACGLCTAFDSEHLQGEPNALIDGMGRDIELGRNLFRRKVLVDEQKTVELPTRELSNPLGHFFVDIARVLRPRRHIHEHLSEQTAPIQQGVTRVRNNLRRFGSIEQFCDVRCGRKRLLCATLFVFQRPISRLGRSSERPCEGWWRGLDSNQRTLARADLQSAAFNHSATSPRGQAGAPCGGPSLMCQRAKRAVSISE